MYQMILIFLEEFLSARFAAPAAWGATVLLAALLSLLTWWLARLLLLGIIKRIAKKRKGWVEIFLSNQVFHRMAAAAVPMTLSAFVSGLPQYGGLLGRATQIIGTLVLVQVCVASLNAVNDIYNRYEISRTRPVRGLLQTIQVVIYIVGGVVVVAGLAGQSPGVLLGSIGAATALTSFIFKDSILGFVAGLQLTGNNMLRIGDWIELPGGSANGTVIDLSMTTVKVQNFDQTITSIPAYRLVSQEFINWRGMTDAGARRIKRAVYIDAGDVRLCDDEMIARLRKIELLQDYLEHKLNELAEYNRNNAVDLSEPVNGRRLTNVGTFRAYLLAYLRRHPGIHHDLSIMVRQLEPDDRGLPLEIYAFAKTTVWAEYENIQSDIFDHLYAVVGEFGLHIYQKPSGGDLRCFRQSENREA